MEFKDCSPKLYSPSRVPRKLNWSPQLGAIKHFQARQAAETGFTGVLWQQSPNWKILPSVNLLPLPLGKPQKTTAVPRGLHCHLPCTEPQMCGLLSSRSQKRLAMETPRSCSRGSFAASRVEREVLLKPSKDQGGDRPELWASWSIEKREKYDILIWGMKITSYHRSAFQPRVLSLQPACQLLQFLSVNWATACKDLLLLIF